MHPSAYANAERFADRYLAGLSPGKLLDVGSLDVNGSLRPIFTNRGWHYTGIDRQAGKNVDIVNRRHTLPFYPETFQVVVSSSALEHDPCFWITFWEMVRVVEPGGLIYICVPSQGKYHAHPVDCWRFQPDCWLGLAEWCPRAELVECYIDPSDELWQDNVGIFRVS